MDPFAQALAAEARRLDLHLETLNDLDPEQLREFAAFALRELAARGLLPAEVELDCWATRRSPAH